jgi:hypothetical protein
MYKRNGGSYITELGRLVYSGSIICIVLFRFVHVWCCIYL